MSFGVPFFRRIRVPFRLCPLLCYVALGVYHRALSYTMGFVMYLGRKFYLIYLCLDIFCPPDGQVNIRGLRKGEEDDTSQYLHT